MTYGQEAGIGDLDYTPKFFQDILYVLTSSLWPICVHLNNELTVAQRSAFDVDLRTLDVFGLLLQQMSSASSEQPLRCLTHH